MNGGQVGRSRSAVVQPCARCGSRWAVQGKPLHWCPRCHGVLLSPAPVDAPADRRNYRWVARPPGRKTPAPQPVRRPAAPQTPRYHQIPRWGLQDRPPLAAPAPRRPLAALGDRVTTALYATAGVFVVAALAELGRYGILLRNRTRLIPSWLLWISDAAVTVSSIVAMAVALATAVTLVGWLAETRRAAYAAAGELDPRSARSLVLGCVIPVANLVWPGVFLTEAARLRIAGGADPRLLRAVRIWWAAWLLNALLVLVSVLYRFASTLQVRADGVLASMWTDLVAAGVAVASLGLVRAFAGLDLRGRPRVPRRWVIATTPAQPVIAPVSPGATERARAASIRDDQAGSLDSDEVTAEQQEVVAK
ncbi:DUF4328 domain-containing protein [Nocardia yunnanensis]|uniref:DUF4328 domain-containing protein n=1 Tax=Nocardia yunnanensis TaxID=2382165 RepID=A0A386ZCA3_9NOCA|nr:DUF4328 domain-containing protein [Nocardia yunnanensis]AYF74724.1 DUF4328 domain-containing protein [Nocardia yunnanensis]